MKVLKGSFFILLVIYARDSSGAIDALYDAGREIWKLYAIIDKMRMLTVFDSKGVWGLLNFKEPTNEEMIDQIDKIHENLKKMEKSMDLKNIHESVKPLPLDIMLYKSIDTMEMSMTSINEFYQKLHGFITGSVHPDEIFRDLMQKILVDVTGNIEVIRKISTDTKKYLANSKNIFAGITDYATNISTQLCDGHQFISDVLIQLFKLLMIAEFKANIMLAVANAHQYIENGGWKEINAFARAKFEEQFGIYVNLLEVNLRLTDTVYLRACDPAGGNWIRNESFYELEETFQATIFRYYRANCKYQSCNDIWFNRPDKCEPTFYDPRTGCADTVADCAYLNAVKACALKNGPYKFQFVNSTTLGPLGTNFQCPADNGYIIDDGWGKNAIHAICTCDCSRNHHKISLETMGSHVELKMVITGFRFYRQNKILYLQPREAKLDANGHILQHSQRWIPVPKKTRQTSHIDVIDQKNRVFFLDDLHLPFAHVLTGIKFNKVTRGSVRGFALEIFGQPFDYRSGKLESGKRFQVSKQVSTRNPGSSLDFKAKNSARITSTNTISPGRLQYISLQRSTLQDDFGQSTLPLFDIVPIVTNPPSLLGGIGIFHKGTENYAGFISLRAYGINYAQYFSNFKQFNMIETRVVFNNTLIN